MTPQNESETDQSSRMPACQWHPYEGDAEQVSYFRKKHPECENHWTEGNFIPFLFGKGLDSGGEALHFLPCHYATVALWVLRESVNTVII